MPKGIYVRVKPPWNKGKKPDREKHPSMGHFQKHTKISKRKIRMANKGKIPWNKGKKGLQVAWNKDKKFPEYSGKGNPHWKGGKTKHNYGYIFIYKPHHPFCNSKGYIFEHRLVMEKMIGRYLKPKEVVHHINGVVDDNRIENLMLFKNNGVHRKYHIIQEGIKSGEIIFDGHKL